MISAMGFAVLRVFRRKAFAAVGRWIARYPPYAFFTLACALAGVAYSLLIIEGTALTAAEGPRTVNVVRDVCLACMAVCSFGAFLTSSAALCRTCLAVKVLAVIIYLAEGPYRAGIEVALLAPILLEIATYEAFFLNLVLSGIVIALFVLVRSNPFLSDSASFALASDNPMSAVLPRLAFSLYLIVLAVVACVVIHYREKCITQSERIEQLTQAVSKLTETNLGYQNYASEASARSQKEERLRITRELHDVIGYTFTNNIMMLEAAVSKIHKDPQKVRELISMARANTETGLEGVRKTLYLLRAQEPVRVPTANKLAELARIFRIATGVEVRIDFANFPNEIEHDLESAFYSFVQQSLTNAFRHGAATSITVQLMQTDHSLIASVLDNGRGAELVTEGIGIKGMRERLAKLGGELRILGLRNGFQISAEVPYREEVGHGG